MTDRMSIQGIRVFGHHGVHSMERRAGQEFLIDVVLDMDMRPAAGTDDLAEAMDYSVLARRIRELVSGAPVNLIETLVHKVADICLEHPRVVACEVTVHKPQAPVEVPVSDISVTIRRTRDQARDQARDQDQSGAVVTKADVDAAGQGLD